MAGRVEIVAEYDKIIRSPSLEMKLPSVIALREYQNLERPATLRRINIYILYGGRCAYCGAKTPTEEITFDHVLPKARGGKSIYKNLVLADKVNIARAGRTRPDIGGRLVSVQRIWCLSSFNRTRFRRLLLSALKVGASPLATERSGLRF
jgi:5-methylcytosine-specific restriction endonuclease McrA